MTTGTEALRLVEAGAIVAGPLDAETVDAVTARTYAHPALEGRRVVRLVPEGLGVAEDLAMEFLGFDRPARPVEVGRGRRVALGFPAWALVNDPANGHHALALVKDLERLSRLARSKPGQAKEGFEELAARLARSVPHFLPTFWEQAGRSFLAADNRLTAASMFGRARESERVHALEIDEDRARDAFLEFAFAGAMPAKALTQHAKDLAQRVEPAAAYDLFLRICLERAAGGLAPYAGMPVDLRRLARAARLDAAEQDERVVRALLPAPVLPHAPLSFWRAYSSTIERLAAGDVVVRTQLLQLLPASHQEGVDDSWLDLLEGSGAVAGLVEVGDGPGVGRPGDGAAGWLERVVAWRGRGWGRPGRSARLLGLVERMAPRLRVEGHPLSLAGARFRGIDLDLVDLCVALGLEVAAPTDPLQGDLRAWVDDDQPGRRDLRALVDDCAWAPDALLADLEHALQPSWHSGSATLSMQDVRPLLENGGTRELVARWLRLAADHVVHGGLPGAEGALTALQAAALGPLFAVEPEAAAAARGADLAPALARTLRTGLFDELGWPALEEAARQFPAVTKRNQPWSRRFEVQDAWPGIVLSNQALAVAVGPEQAWGRHDVRLPKGAPQGHTRLVAQWVDGQFLIAFSDGMVARAYWSARPDDVFTVPDSLLWRGPVGQHSLPLPTGGRTGGGRPLLPWDRAFSMPRPVASDGRAWWRLEEHGWVEFDPATGHAGRRSLPAFFEAALDTSGLALVPHACDLAPVPAGLEGSPLGTSGGLLGWRTLQGEAGQLGGSVDGSSVSIDASSPFRAARPVASLRLPDGSRVAVLRHEGALLLWDGEHVGSWVAEEHSAPDYARGTPVVPPLRTWHALRPRDLPGSAALRAVTVEQARALLACDPRSSRADAVRQVLPEVTHPALVAGIAGALGVAQRCAKIVAGLPEATEAPPLVRPAVTGAAVAGAAEPSDRALARALAGIGSSDGAYGGGYALEQGSSGGGSTAISGLCAAVGALLEPSPASPAPVQASPVETSPVDWSCLVGGLGAVALRAVCEATPEDERAALVALLEAACDTPLVEVDGRWRTLNAHGQGAELERPGLVARTQGGRAVVLHSGSSYDVGGLGRLVLEHSPEGTFGTIPAKSVEQRGVASGWGGRQAVRELLDLLAERGPAPWRPEPVATLASATGMSTAQASLLLAGLPRIDSYEHGFLDPHTRKVLGLKLADAARDRKVLADLPRQTRNRLLERALPARLVDLWDSGPDAAAVATAWVGAFGRRASVPEDLAAEWATVMRAHRDLEPGPLLQGLLEPDSCAWLARDREWAVHNVQLRSKGDREGFAGQQLAPALGGLLWLSYRLPPQSPLRAALPRAHELLLERVSHPGLLVEVLQQRELSALRPAYGHPPLADPMTDRPDEAVPLADAGVLLDHGYYWQSLVLRVSALGGPDHPLLETAVALLDPTAVALRHTYDPALGDLLEAAHSGWAQDPLVTARATVIQVEQALGVPTDSARVYLQVLALPDPTDKSVARWNDWRPQQVKQALAPLLAAGLLVPGKRARAGRGAFLPGGWLDVKAPMPPVEAWKVPLLGLGPDGRAPLGVNVPTVAPGTLFETAWARVAAGDAPGLTVLETGARR